MMSVNHVQSRMCHITVLADAGTGMSNRMLTAVDLMATGVIVKKHFLNVTYSSFKYKGFHSTLSAQSVSCDSVAVKLRKQPSVIYNFLNNHLLEMLL